MTAYHELIRLNVKHAYYSDGVSSDFDIKPLTKTARQIANHRLIFRADESSAKLFAPLHADKVMVSLDDITGMTFGLSLKNPAFNMFSALSEQDPSHKAAPRPADTAGKLWIGKRPSYILQNTVGSTNLTEKAYTLLTCSLPVDVDTQDKSVTITVKNEAAENVIEHVFAVPKEEGQAKGRLTTALDLSLLEDGPYTVSVSSAPGNAKDIFLLKDAHESCFRYVHLKFAATGLMNADETPKARQDFDVSFTAIEKKWDYLVTLTGTNAAHDYKIVHVPEGGASQINFENPVVELQETKKKILRITTAAKVAYKQKPYANIKLVKTGGSGDQDVLENLPNPSPSNAGSEVYIQL